MKTDGTHGTHGTHGTDGGRAAEPLTVSGELLPHLDRQADGYRQAALGAARRLQARLKALVASLERPGYAPTDTVLAREASSLDEATTTYKTLLSVYGTIGDALLAED